MRSYSAFDLILGFAVHLADQLFLEVRKAFR